MKNEMIIPNIKELIEDYAPDRTIWNDDLEKVDRVKVNITKLPEYDRNLILLYIELQSMRKVANLLNCSTATVCKRIKEIKNKITQ